MQPRTQAENFMRGALLITLAQLATKILGAVHRPVAQRIIGDPGLNLATPPSAAYYIILGLSSVGLNVAISRLVSERVALGDYRGAKRVFRVALNMLVLSGVVFSLLFYLGAGWMAGATSQPDARAGFVVLAPALFFVALVCAYRGLFQGIQQMQPSAMSQVVEQVVRVTLSIGLMLGLARISLPYGAAGFNAGNAIGIAISVAYLAWVMARTRPMEGWDTTAPGVASIEHESASQIVGKILSIALPLSLIATILPIMQLVDSYFVPRNLGALGLPEADQALAWLANAGTMRDLPTILTTALYTSLVPAITESVTTGRHEQARYRIGAAFRVTFLVAFPATVGLLVGARDVYGVLYEGAGYLVMAPLAWSTLFVMIQQTSAGTLQGMGRIWTSVGNLLIGLVVKSALTYWWTTMPLFGAQGAAYATGVGFAVTAGLNLWVLWRYLGYSVDVQGAVIRPLGAAVVMGGAIWLVSPLVHQVIHSAFMAGVLVVGFGGLIYLLAIFALGGVTEADLAMIPGIPRGLPDRLRRYRLLRD